MEENIGEITRKHVLADDAITPNQALALLVVEDPEIDKTLSRVAFRYAEDKNDLKQQLALKVLEGKHEIHNLKPWCRKSATNLCNNDSRHAKVERAHKTTKLAVADVHGRINSTGGGTIAIQRPSVATPEQEAIEEEQKLLLRDTLRKVSALSQRHKVIVELWGQEKPPKQIAAETGIPTSTVYRLLGEIQEAIIFGLGIKSPRKRADV
jgi:RNA polymerase sigma factor (sigma-70 family)